MKISRVAFQMIVLTVAALLITTGCLNHELLSASKPEKRPVLVEPSVGVDKVLKGMNRDQVEAAIGKPEKIMDKWWVYSHRGMIVAFGDNGVMFNIKCSSPFSGVTKEGIGIGSTRAELLAAYGKPSQEKNFPGFDDLWFAPLGISFDLTNDKVTSFIVHLDVR